MLPLPTIAQDSIVCGTIMLLSAQVGMVDWRQWGLAGAIVGVVLWQSWAREKRLGARIDELENRYVTLIESVAVAQSKTADALCRIAERPCQYAMQDE